MEPSADGPRFRAAYTENACLVGAARLDENNRLEDMAFSPRAALVYQPVENQNFGFTCNRAYSTPDNNNLYMDLLQATHPFSTGMDIWVQGAPEIGRLAIVRVAQTF